MYGLYIAVFLTSILLIMLIYTIIFHHKFFGKRWEPDNITKYYEPDSFPDLCYEKVEFLRKKTILRGYIYFYERTSYKGIFVFSHGMWGSHKSYIQEIERLAKDGYKVLGFDYYGTDLSDGKKTRSFVESLYSLDYAIKFVKENFDLDIYVMGHSWGGFAAVNILKYHPEIKKVVAMAPFMSVVSLSKSILPKKLWIFIPFLYLIEFFKSPRYFNASGFKTLPNVNSEVLILHSKDDNMVKFNFHTGYLKEINKNKKVKFIIFNNKRHNPDYSDQAVEYMKKVVTEVRQLNNEDKVIYRKEIDYVLLGELDDNVIKQILDFLK